ncbi:aminotransferase [Xylariales sp. PMI_506]|nr:aminotransferase [Xylariales sp. PMI_506]
MSIVIPTGSQINLQLGWPTPSLFARAGLLKGAEEVLTSEKESAAALVYGPHIGHPPLRESLAEWLCSVYSSTEPTTKDRICITNGASGNLANILQRYTDPQYTRRIFMVEPTYFLACPIFEDNGFQGKLRGVPEDSTDGLDIEFLRRKLQAAEADSSNAAQPITKVGPNYPKIYKYIIYIVPTFSNPSGKTLSLRGRQDLVMLAREYDALVVSDDVYDFLQWPEDPAAPDDAVSVIPPRLVDVDRTTPGYSTWGNTVSNGSFSKVIGPGVRVGWADCAPEFAKQLAETGSSSSGGAPSHLSSTFVDKMLRSGYLKEYIDNTLVPTYRKRYYVMRKAIDEFLVPMGVKVDVNRPVDATTETAGGFFIYLRLPSDMPSAKIVAAIAFKEYQLRIAFGHMFTVTGDEQSVVRAEADYGFAKCVRLCWAWHEEAEIRTGIERLATAIGDIRERVKRGEDVGSNISIGIR